MFRANRASGIVVIFLDPFNLGFEFCNHLALLLHETSLFICELGFQVHDLLFELSDALLQLHLDEFFVITCIVLHLLDYALVLLLERFHLFPVLISQVGLHLFKLLLRPDLQCLKFRLDISKLLTESLGRLIATLHSLVQLSLHIGKFGLEGGQLVLQT